METIDILLANLISPVVLAFVLGVVASLIRSDLSLPEPLYQALSIYLLLAIGLKGGVELSHTPVSDFMLPALATLALGVITPIIAYYILRRVGKIDLNNAAALAAHYGSVSAVTFIVALSVADLTGQPAEGFMPALVALLEAPAIIVGLMIAFVYSSDRAGSWQEALHEVLAGRSIVLMIGGMIIGFISGEAGMKDIEPFFVTGFKGALALFLLEMGIVAARQLRELKQVGFFLLGFGILIPLFHGWLGVSLGHAAGLSVGGSAVFGAMVSSASYIAAPAAVRIALPSASMTYCLTASLGITFPFNLTIGIPLYFKMAAFYGV